MPRMVRALAVRELQPGEMKALELNGSNVLLVNVGGTVHAVSNLCTHEEAYLSEGKVENNCIICPLHDSQFDLKTGEVLLPPAEKPLPVYNVSIKDDSIYVEM